MHTGLIFDVKRYSIHDGPGIRTTVFFKGCSLTCWWCHNPESRSPSPFVHYDPGRCLVCGACVEACPQEALAVAGTAIRTDPKRCLQHGECADVCPSEARQLVGRTVTVPEVLAEVEKDRLYFDETGGGVTFSGGEPLLQWEFLVEVLRACGQRDIHRAVDTTGYASPEVLMRVAQEADLFLYDIKTMDPELHERATGAPLRPILNNLVRLLSSGVAVRIRIPLIPGISTDESLDTTGAFLATLPGVEGVNLLPYHRSARDKHARFGVPWRMETDDDLPEGRTQEAAALLEGHGLRVEIGG